MPTEFAPCWAKPSTDEPKTSKRAVVINPVDFVKLISIPFWSPIGKSPRQKRFRRAAHRGDCKSVDITQFSKQDAKLGQGGLRESPSCIHRYVRQPEQVARKQGFHNPVPPRPVHLVHRYGKDSRGRLANSGRPKEGPIRHHQSE